MLQAPNATDGGFFGYDPRADLDGSGDIFGSDATFASDRIGSFVSAPTAPPLAAPALNGDDELGDYEDAVDDIFGNLND